MKQKADMTVIGGILISICAQEFGHNAVYAKCFKEFMENESRGKCR